MKYTILCSLFLAMLFFSCGAGDVYKVDIRDSKNFDISRDKVWKTVLDMMAREIYVVKSISEQRHMVQYDFEEIPADSIFKYTTTKGGKYIAAARSVFIEVKGDSIESTIIINAVYEGIWQGFDILGRLQNGMQKLYSNGKFESEFFAKLENKLRKE